MEKVLIIAEAGVNHNGSITIARKLIDAAKECGADIVKFQTMKTELLVSKYASMAEYQKKNIGKEESQKEMLDKLILSYDEFHELAEYCKRKKIGFLSTPFDIDSIHFLNDLQDIWKIPSGEITNYPYLVEIGKSKKPVILSTGMSTLDEVSEALAVLKENGTDDITVLHCTTEYPAPIESVNLRAMITIQEKFGCKIGYSDHTQGIEISIAAVAMGASVIEKHFTLDRKMEGPDHKASLEPNELAAMIKAIRKTEQCLGTGIKIPFGSEVKNRDVARKSIVAKRHVKKGEIFSEDNITTKRPGDGINPMRWNTIIGTSAIKDFEEDEQIVI